ncbi:2-oxoglutarate dehydrogenase E1 [Domibacillus antri]|uniref:2-oxoglutarate dehydrogenase E1 n=1 Tax=Domibacillus antri TaxID=1714264 RepID=A0A1Q8Q240_9BACI|nr:ASCH domain-containing protein [Domibacillus antri]OLN21413.1 2-oxoglutarate dehydrogenase E1 [Domibacillus antri]
MKAITIKQPWATLIALGEKRFETRSWQTKYRGQIAIHAGKSIDKEACEDTWIKSTLAEHGIRSYKDLPTGAVLAIAEIQDCHKVVTNFCNQIAITTGPGISGLEIKFGDYTEGRFAWELDNIKTLPSPVDAKGKLSLWEWDHADEAKRGNKEGTAL